MTDELERLYERALELPRSARDAFVDESCGANAALREELRSLLAHSDAAERFFGRLGGAMRAAVPALDDEIAYGRIVGGESAGPSASGLVSSLTSFTSSLSTSAATTDDDSLIGRSVRHYRILSLLGRGGMGTVYRAHDERLARDVALKFLPPHVAAEPGAAARFLAEARAAAALAHPNVCTVHEIGESDEGRSFIAMALYEGETLRERLRGGPLTPRDAATIARQLASALAAAHACGIVHRDVKPGNVMLARDGLARLLDFGLAQVGDASRAEGGATPGTIAYMSPEQASGGAIDHRSDLWSLGVVLHEMLSGTRPFRGSGRAVLQAIVHDPPASLDACDPAVPVELQRIVERLLRKAPDERYADAAGVESDLALALATPLAAPLAMHPDHAMTDTATAPRIQTTRWMTRHRVGITVFVIASVIVSVIASVGAGVALRGRGSRVAGGATSARAVAAPAARSLAVLPFVGLSGDSTDRYFGDGLTDQITTELGQIEGLRVAGRGSAFALRDRGLDVRRIADTLGVDAVLEGSVRRAGSRARVTAQLVDARTGLNIWAAEYDREAASIIAVQDEIARAIADALELRIPSNGAHVRLRGETELAAYDLYLRALQLRNSMSADALQRATDLLDRAIELQPDFALAYAAKASVVAPRVYFRQIPRDRGVREVRAAIDRAFALDPQLGEAHVALGLVQLFFDRDWSGAERSLRRAIALNPNDPHAWHHLANYYRAMNRPTEAAAIAQRGLALDPLNARMRVTLAEDYLHAGRLDDALASFERAAQLDPLLPLILGFGPNPPMGASRVYLAQGRDADAVRDLLRVATLRGASAGEVDSLRGTFARSGMHAFWRRWLVMDRRQTGASIDPVRVAILSALAGDTAQALSSLERAYAEQNPGLIFMRAEPSFAALHALPRYRRIEEAMHFPSR